MKKFPKIITKGGDGGQTSRWSGERIDKSSTIIEAISFIDLFDSSLGLLYSHLGNTIDDSEILDSIKKIQTRLIYVKGEISTSDGKFRESFYKKSKPITPVDVDYLEKCSEKFRQILEERGYEINTWVTYGEEGELSAKIDYCGRLCRLCEVKICQIKEENIRGIIKIYINRLSDYLYLLARYFSK